MEQMKAIFEKIKAYDRILLFRHKRPDGDAIGAAFGLREILRLSFPEKEVLSINCDASEQVGFLGEEDAPIPDEKYADALGITIDTATEDRIANPRYMLCRELLRIDHHIDANPYGTLAWIEPTRSSACEMIAAFYFAFRDELKINRAAATYIYTGMVTDSDRFRFRTVTGETLRLAAMLLDEGVDLDYINTHLYVKEFHTLKFCAHVYKKMKMTKSGVSYLFVDRAMQKKFALTSEQAGAAVNYMEAIKGSLIWLVFIEGQDGSLRVRLRSRFVAINSLAEKYGGGGHACACGATAKNKREALALVRDADVLLADYKATHEGWL